MEQFIVNVEGAVHKDGHWLIIKRSEKEEHAGGLLSLVGGKVEREGNMRDILERTVKREVLEEVGIYVKNRMTYVHSTSFVVDEKYHVVDIVFLCEHESGVVYAKSEDEVDGVWWMTFEEVAIHPDAPDYLIESLRRAEETLREDVKTKL
ncbi:NUDIX domain-containing protein [Pseudalkalibacillus berkeleyi]|uniref:NUDIX domain-containing protein n=1 Tax=Pseudalkalibacillus berkeleyi TaxID=1069813 RepID=A0ABS9GXY1_9BACL|nr:NUDIX domain-containing protein [Pseudalkalibacillus berkeleyi]MCF6136681.1 NUDIX domain-containing protein [Pseudalkalibacillus berkeleyi]